MFSTNYASFVSFNSAIFIEIKIDDHQNDMTETSKSFGDVIILRKEVLPSRFNRYLAQNLISGYWVNYLLNLLHFTRTFGAVNHKLNRFFNIDRFNFNVRMPTLENPVNLISKGLANSGHFIVVQNDMPKLIKAG